MKATRQLWHYGDVLQT